MNALQPASDTAKTKWLNAMSVFGFFEKKINGRDSILVEGPGRGYLKNAQLEFSENKGNTAGRGESTLSFPSGSGCSYTMTVTETYTYLEIYVNGNLAGIYQNYTVQMAVSIICTGDESSSPSGGGGGGGWNWYNYATGGYFNSSSPVNGQYWWTNLIGGGGGGGGAIYTQQVQYLKNALTLTPDQSDFLQSNPQLAENLYNSIFAEDEVDEMVIASAKINIEVARQGLIENWDELAFKLILDTYLPIELRVYKDVIVPYIKLQYAIEADNDPALKQTWLGKIELLYRATNEMLHLGLDFAGLVPVVGEVFDLTSATLYLLEGDGFNASLSAASAVPIAGWFASGIKLAKQTIILSTGAKTTLKWLKRLDGSISFGNRGQLRKVLNLAKGDTRWAHHLIPWETANHSLVQKAAKGDNAFHLNEVLNGLPLNSIQHAPPHDIYNTKIINRLDNLYLQNGGKYMSNSKAEELVRALSNEIKVWVSAHPNSSINDIIFP